MEAKIKSTLGDTLHEACQNGNLNDIQTYISHQRATNPTYNPPYQEILYAAITNDNLPIAKYCLENHAHASDDILKKILICRAKNIYIYLLSCAQVDINHYIPWYGDILSNAATANDLTWTRLCLDHGADPNLNLVDEHKSILAAAAELASVDMVALLIDGGAQVKGSGAIVMAAEEGKGDVVRYLLDHGADVDEMGIEHPTDERYREDVGSALHRAAYAGHCEVVELLVGRGANLDLRDLSGRTAMDLAVDRGNERVMEVLRGAGATKT